MGHLAAPTRSTWPRARCSTPTTRRSPARACSTCCTTTSALGLTVDGVPMIFHIVGRTLDPDNNGDVLDFRLDPAAVVLVLLPRLYVTYCYRAVGSTPSLLAGILAAGAGRGWGSLLWPLSAAAAGVRAAEGPRLHRTAAGGHGRLAVLGIRHDWRHLRRTARPRAGTMAVDPVRARDFGGSRPDCPYAFDRSRRCRCGALCQPRGCCSRSCRRAHADCRVVAGGVGKLTGPSQRRVRTEVVRFRPSPAWA